MSYFRRLADRALGAGAQERPLPGSGPTPGPPDTVPAAGLVELDAVVEVPPPSGPPGARVKAPRTGAVGSADAPAAEPPESEPAARSPEPEPAVEEVTTGEPGRDAPERPLDRNEAFERALAWVAAGPRERSRGEAEPPAVLAHDAAPASASPVPPPALAPGESLAPEPPARGTEPRPVPALPAIEIESVEAPAPVVRVARPSARGDGRSRSAVEETVDVAIGAIHVVVEAPPTSAPVPASAAPAPRRRSPEPPDRNAPDPAGSRLERYYLRP